MIHEKNPVLSAEFSSEKFLFMSFSRGPLKKPKISFKKSGFFSPDNYVFLNCVEQAILILHQAS